MPKLSKLASTTAAPIISRSESSLVQLQSQSQPPSHDHICQLILAQTSPSQALQTFRWASLFPTFIHSQSTYRALVCRLCAFRRFGTALQLLDEMPHSIGAPPDDDIFVTLVGGLARARMTSQVLSVLDLVHKFGKAPTLKLFNSILHVLVKEDIDLARKFYRKKMVGSGVSGDHYTFGILMKGLCLTNRIGDAFRLLQIIKSRDGSKPNAVVYNTLLFALCRNGKVGRARSLMNEMEDPNHVTFNILISGYCKDSNLVQALVMQNKALTSGFVPDIVTVTKLVELLCSAGRVTEAVEVLDRVEVKGGKIDVVAYNALMKGFCIAGKPKVASGLLKEMEGKGCLPNVDTYNVLISGFCKSGMLDSALDFFNDMQTDGISPNFTTYDVLIRGLFLGGRMRTGFKILELMEDMKGGSRGRINPYNNILYGFYKNNLWDDAMEFLLKMKKLFPKTVDRTLKIMALCEQGAVVAAKRIFDQMTDEGGTPSVLVYDCLINGFCEDGQVREAFDLMNEMVGQGYLPVASALNSIISEFCTRGKDGNALKLLEDMVEKGYIPNAQSYSPLIHGLCKNGNFHKGYGLLLQMVEKGITPDRSTWNSLLLCPSQEFFLSKAKDLLHVSNLIESPVEA